MDFPASFATRFAPSPTGHLHLGHALAAFVAWSRAKDLGGKFYLRIEDIDSTRCRPEYETSIKEDLLWLGFPWDGVVIRQSEQGIHYARALEQLQQLGVVYPCFCTRAEIQREVASMHGAPHGPDGPLYPGSCRHLTALQREEKLHTTAQYSWRLNIAAATALTGPLTWQDERHGEFIAAPERLGDVILARKDISTSYHLAVVVDDARQGITHVTRGEDLIESTHIHRLLQALLQLPVPMWHHHTLVCDEAGKRLAKRHDALSLQTLREQGHKPEHLLARINKVLKA